MIGARSYSAESVDKSFRAPAEVAISGDYAAIDGEKPDGLPTFEDGMRTARMVDAASRSASATHGTEI